MDRGTKRSSIKEIPRPGRLVMSSSLITGSAGIVLLFWGLYMGYPDTGTPFYGGFTSRQLFVQPQMWGHVVLSILGLCSSYAAYKGISYARKISDYFFVSLLTGLFLIGPYPSLLVALILQSAAIVLLMIHASGKRHSHPDDENMDSEKMDNTAEMRGKVINDRYEILKLIGRGASGKVYHVRDRKSADTEAIWVFKELDFLNLNMEEQQEREKLFMRECELLSSLNHPAIPKLIEHFTFQGIHYMVMEPVHGENLESRVKKCGRPLGNEEALKLAVELSRILEYLHNTGPHPLIYRDLKPSNIILTEKGKARLIDFGIARHYHPGKDKDTLAYGTPGFSPPEQYGLGQTDERSDIYSLGATLYFLLTLEDPRRFHFNFLPVRTFNHNVPHCFERIIMKCLSRDPAERYTDIPSLMHDLGEVREYLKLEAGSREPGAPLLVLLSVLFFIIGVVTSYSIASSVMLFSIIIRLILLARSYCKRTTEVLVKP